MLNGNGSLDTQTHRLIQALIDDLPTSEMQLLAEPPPITGMHEIPPLRRDED